MIPAAIDFRARCEDSTGACPYEELAGGRNGFAARFDLEQTHLTEEDRIKKLIARLTLAVCWAHLIGEACVHHTPLKIKNHGEKEKSLFRYGLDHLQDVLLNSQDHARTVQRGLKIVKEARFLPDS